MALNPTLVQPRWWAVQFDGSNGQEISDWLCAPIMVDYGTSILLTFTFEVGRAPQIVNQGEWVIGSPYTPARFFDVVPDAEMANAYVTVP